VTQLPRTIDDVRRFLPIRPPHFQPGHRIAGHDLQLDVLLGQGGFAEVWKAHNTEFRSRPPVALKFCLDQELLPSLRREIEVLDRLKDDEPGKDFVRLLQTAYSADPPFLIYEYIDGGDVAGWVKSFDGKAPGESSVVSVLKMTARAVAVAHDSGVVHRDLKPSNLLMTRSGRVKVADFGIGAVVSEFEASKAGGKSDLSGAHTPMYADPMKDRWARPDPQDDVYAIGVLACQLLMGDVSFQMKGSWQRQLQERNVSAGLIDVVETCVAPSGQRFKDAGALLAALEREPAGAAKRDTPRQARKAAESPKPKFCHMCGKPSARSNLYCNACGYQFP
jgi:serine/threonine protein kinase